MLVKTIIKSAKLKVFCFLKDSTVLFLFFILPLVTCPSWGQVVQKKELSESDYHLWGETHFDKISNDENWISHTVEYQNGNDTLFVRNVVNNKIFYFAKGTNSIFTNDDFFICQIAGNLQILDLKTYKTESISGAVTYSYCKATNKLLITVKKTNQDTSLLIRSLSGNKVEEIKHVTDFQLSPTGRFMVYSSFLNNQSEIHLIDLKKGNNIKRISIGSQADFVCFTWDNTGKAVAFLKQSTDLKFTSLLYYILKEDTLFEFKPESASGFPQDNFIYWDPFYKIVISDDLQRVFFSIKKDSEDKNKQNQNVEIWNGNDKWIYPQEQKTGNFATSPKIAVWFPKLNVFKQITTEESPKLMLTGDLQNAVLFNPKDYEPQFEDQGPSDFYLLSLKTFKKEILIKEQYGGSRSIVFSPSGRFTAYFKNENWWVYDTTLKTHKNISVKIGTKFTGKNQMLAPESLYGSPGWSSNEEEILFYDQYDIWAVKCNGNSYRRLTRGRESKIVFRLAQSPLQKGLNYIYDGSKSIGYNLDEVLILHAVGEDGKTGYFSWNSDSGEKSIVYQDSFTDELNYVSKQGRIFFREQKFDLPPQLKTIDKDLETRIIYRSNPQQDKYFWGKSELVPYQNSKGEQLKAVLLYPANYDPLKKYPMVVHIYEIQSKELYIYCNPTLNNGSGFNPSVFTSKGYFVLMPDILLEPGNPGNSAKDCVVSATQKIIDSGFADPLKIGLMGHSFGGYETFFITTQTEMFSAAVPSGGITDLNSFYFTVNQKSGKPDMWRFQSEQWNMRKSPFESAALYDENSPIKNAESVTTPLLLWSGKEDQQVDVKQSIEFYLALRRLGKKNIMLLYPQEGHTLIDTVNQKDITIRILQWFDYFLKNERSASSSWITEGVM